MQNTGFMIDKDLFYPGDALFNPERTVSVLALPVAGPWIKISEAIDYALAVKPKVCFPVHDGMLSIFGGFHAIPQEVLPQHGIDFFVPEINKEYDI